MKSKVRRLITPNSPFPTEEHQVLLNVRKYVKSCDLTISRNPLLVGYVLIWAAYLFTCVITPAKSLYKDTHAQGVFLIAVYVVLSAACAFFLMAVFPKRPANETTDKIGLLYDYLQPHRSILLTGFLVICGLLLHLYDKVFVMKIDYSQGIAMARHAWLANGAARGGGISSWQSVTGHILVNLYFIVIAMALLFWKELPRFYKYFGYLVSVIAVLIYSASIGSRSVPLFFLFYVISTLLLEKSLGKSFLPKGFRCLFVLLVLLIFAYNIFVFHERGEVSGGGDPKQYTQSFFTHLKGKETSGFDKGEKLPEFLSELFYYGVLTTIYVNHNQWTFDYVLTLDERPGQSMFNTFYGGLVKVGLMSRDRIGKRAFSGVFLSLPGCAYYDFGVVGMTAVALLHGVLLSVANRLVQADRLRVSCVFLFLLVSIFSLISPLTSAANLMSFPYLIISCLCLPLLVRIVKLPFIKQLMCVLKN